MVSVLIFAAHIIFFVFVFTKKWRKESISSAVINALLIIILFSVGWTISTMLMKIFFEPKGFGEYFNRDDISLTVLTIAEYFFYRFYYGKEDSIAGGKEK